MTKINIDKLINSLIIYNTFVDFGNVFYYLILLFITFLYI